MNIFRYRDYNDNKKIKIGDFVKIKDDSDFYEGDKLYKVEREDRISFYLRDITNNNYFERIKKHVRELTKPEKVDLQIMLDSQKYNL